MCFWLFAVGIAGVEIVTYHIIKVMLGISQQFFSRRIIRSTRSVRAFCAGSQELEKTALYDLHLSMNGKVLHVVILNLNVSINNNTYSGYM